MKMPSLKFTPKNLEKLGIILMVILLVFRPGFIKKFSNNLIGKMLLLGGIVSVASHNKMYGLLAAFTYVVCVEMTSEGHPEKDKTNAGEAEKDETNAGSHMHWKRGRGRIVAIVPLWWQGSIASIFLNTA